MLDHRGAMLDERRDCTTRGWHQVRLDAEDHDGALPDADQEEGKGGDHERATQHGYRASSALAIWASQRTVTRSSNPTAAYDSIASPPLASRMSQTFGT